MPQYQFKANPTGEVPPTNSRPSLVKFLNLQENDTLPSSDSLLESMLQIQLERERSQTEDKRCINLQLSMQYFQMALQAQVPPHLIPFLFSSNPDQGQFTQPYVSSTRDLSQGVPQRVGKMEKSIIQTALPSYAKVKEDKPISTRPTTPTSTQNSILGKTGTIPRASETGIEFQHYSVPSGELPSSSLSSRPVSLITSSSGEIIKKRMGHKPSNASTSSTSSKSHKRTQSEMSGNTPSHLGSPYIIPPKLNNPSHGMYAQMHYPPPPPLPPPPHGIAVAGPSQQYSLVGDSRVFHSPQYQGTMSPQLYSEYQRGMFPYHVGGNGMPAVSGTPPIVPTPNSQQQQPPHQN